MKQQQLGKILGNSTCRHLGHAYRSTTTDLYRVCSRPGCRAKQHLINGKWCEVTPERRKRHDTDTAQQQPLF